LAEEQPQQVLQLYKKAFATNNVLVRQAISTYLREIPPALKTNYESLLNDRSYLTIEQALFNLWQNFPEDGKKYLKNTEGLQGFSNKNIRLLWLTLSLVTQDFQPNNNTIFYKELSGYTQPKYAYEIRENAFGFLYQIDSFAKQNYLDLLEGAVHPVWRFRNFCRELIKELSNNQKHRTVLGELKTKLPDNQEKILTKILEK
jgi:aminopeptidase N